MEDFRIRLSRAIEPYIIVGGTLEGGPLYDYGVCGVIENFLDDLMEREPVCTSYSYLDFDTDGVVVKGCMTVTFMEYYMVPEVFTFLYEKDLRDDG